MTQQLKIKFLKAYGLIAPGQIMEMDAPVAQELIRSGKAELVVEPKGKEPKAAKKQAK